MHVCARAKARKLLATSSKSGLGAIARALGALELVSCVSALHSDISSTGVGQREVITASAGSDIFVLARAAWPGSAVSCLYKMVL